MARKRGPPKPPLSYTEKYRQIKQSGFNVDIPRPTTSKAKALVTRYHKLLYGGKSRSGKRTIGKAKHYEPYKGKYQEQVGRVWDKRGLPRLKNPLVPKGTKIKKVTKNSVTIETKYGTEVLRITDRNLLLRNPREALEKSLEGTTRKRFKVRVNDRITNGTFDKEAAIDRAIQLMNIYEDYVDFIYIEEFDTRNQESVKAYKAAKRRSN